MQEQDDNSRPFEIHLACSKFYNPYFAEEFAVQDAKDVKKWPLLKRLDKSKMRDFDYFKPLGRKLYISVFEHGLWKLFGTGDNTPECAMGTGRRDMGSKDSFVEVVDLRRIKVEDIVAGDKHTLLRSSQGLIYSWGSNDSGQLGRDVVAGSRHVFRAGLVQFSEQATKICAVRSRSMALARSGCVYRWGEQSGPYPKLLPESESQLVLGIHSSPSHDFVFYKNGTISLFGYNTYESLHIPNVKGIAALDHHFFLLGDDDYLLEYESGPISRFKTKNLTAIAKVYDFKTATETVVMAVPVEYVNMGYVYLITEREIHANKWETDMRPYNVLDPHKNVKRYSQILAQLGAHTSPLMLKIVKNLHKVSIEKIGTYDLVIKYRCEDNTDNLVLTRRLVAGQHFYTDAWIRRMDPNGLLKYGYKNVSKLFRDLAFHQTRENVEQKLVSLSEIESLQGAISQDPKYLVDYYDFMELYELKQMQEACASRISMLCQTDIKMVFKIAELVLMKPETRNKMREGILHVLKEFISQQPLHVSFSAFNDCRSKNPTNEMMDFMWRKFSLELMASLSDSEKFITNFECELDEPDFTFTVRPYTPNDFDEAFESSTRIEQVYANNRIIYYLTSRKTLKVIILPHQKVIIGDEASEAFFEKLIQTFEPFNDLKIHKFDCFRELVIVLTTEGVVYTLNLTLPSDNWIEHIEIAESAINIRAGDGYYMVHTVSGYIMAWKNSQSTSSTANPLPYDIMDDPQNVLVFRGLECYKLLTRCLGFPKHVNYNDFGRFYILDEIYGLNHNCSRQSGMVQVYSFKIEGEEVVAISSDDSGEQLYTILMTESGRFFITTDCESPSPFIIPLSDYEYDQQLNFKNFQHAARQSDLSIQNRGCVFKVHKQLICMGSYYFQQLLVSNPNVSNIVLEEDSEALERFIKCLYCSNGLAMLSLTNVIKIFNLAVIYEAPYVKEACYEQIIRRAMLNHKWFEVIKLVEIFCILDARKLVWSYFCHNFSSLFQKMNDYEPSRFADFSLLMSRAILKDNSPLLRVKVEPTDLHISESNFLLRKAFGPYAKLWLKTPGNQQQRRSRRSESRSRSRSVSQVRSQSQSPTSSQSVSIAI